MPEKGGDGSAAGKRHFEAARRAVPDEPRALYAYGIVLLAQRKPKEALEQFRAAAGKSKAPYLPALQGIAWLHVSRNEYSQGMTALLDLAGRIENCDATWPSADDREQAAEWIGRMAGYLAGPGQTAGQAAQAEKMAGDIQKRLTAERKSAYERGRKAVGDRHDELRVLAARPADEVAGEVNREKEEIRTALQAAEAEEKRLDDELRELKSAHSKQIAELTRDIRVAGQNIKKANRDLPDVAELVEDLSQPRKYTTIRRYSSTSSTRTRTSVGTRSETTEERKSREAELASAKKRLAELQSSLESANQRLAEARSQRTEAQAEVNQAAAEKRPGLMEARRKREKLKARAQAAERALLSPEEITLRLTELDMYLPLDPVSEKARLLATLKSPG